MAEHGASYASGREKPCSPLKRGEGKRKNVTETSAGHKDGRVRHPNYNSKRPISGPGIFVTCARGREGRCVGEMYDLLDEMADRLYPSERLAEYEKLRPLRKGLDAEAKLSEDVISDATNPNGEIRNGDDVEDDSIEASIAKELAALKSSRNTRKPRNKTAITEISLNNEEKGEEKVSKPRFVSLDTDTGCLVFIATRWPYNPVELAHAIVKDIQQTGISRTRYTNKLQPVAFICPALNLEDVSSKSAALIEDVFERWSRENHTTNITYQIEPSVRSHNRPLDRAALLDILGAKVRSLTETSSMSSPTSRPPLTVKANLTQPDLVLVPVVLRNHYGLSVIEGKDWYGNAGRKWNLEMVSVEARRLLEGQKAPDVTRIESLLASSTGESSKMDDCVLNPGMEGRVGTGT